MAVTYNQQQEVQPIVKPKPIKEIKNGVTLADVKKAQPNFAKKIEERNNITEVNGKWYNTDELINYQQEALEQKAKEDQQALWDREDKLREHIEQREDTAYSRAIADLRSSGANINLITPQPAGSGGGITSATPKDYTLQDTMLKGEIDKALQDLEQAFQGRENEKDRLNRIFTTLGIGSIMKIGK